MTDDAEQTIGRGRMIPTTSWEAIWAPLAHWFGVDEAALSEMFPNMANFTNILDRDTLFRSEAVAAHDEEETSSGSDPEETEEEADELGSESD
jgi:hypothetical protein